MKKNIIIDCIEKEESEAISLRKMKKQNLWKLRKMHKKLEELPKENRKERAEPIELFPTRIRNEILILSKLEKINNGVSTQEGFSREIAKQRKKLM